MRPGTPGFVFSWGGAGNPRRRESLPRPHTGPQAQPAGMETAPGFLPGGIISYRGGSNSAHHRYASMNLFGCRSPAEADDRLDGRLRIERPALTPCARWGSKSRPPSRRTAGLSPERRLLSAPGYSTSGAAGRAHRPRSDRAPASLAEAGVFVEMKPATDVSTDLGDRAEH